MVSNSTLRNNALLFLKVAPNTTVGDDGILSVALNFNDKEQVEHYRKAATSILNWIDMNEQASGGNATVRTGQVRRYKTRKELGISDDIGWTHDDSPNFVVVGQVGDKSAWAVQDVNGQNSRMVRTVDLENNTLIIGEA